jgi:DNA polymerase-3 subunit epsilon
MNFIALDVETANPDYSSICQIGLAVFQDGHIIDSWVTLVNPETYFDEINVSIHGIDEEDVSDSPTITQIYPKIRDYIENQVVIHHMPFDRIALTRSFENYGLEKFPIKWIDSAKVVRRTWSKFERSGYGLQNVASEFNIQFKHHDALEDAMAAGEVVLRAIAETGITLDNWFQKVIEPIHPQVHIKCTGNPEGSLFGEEIVFTGALSMPRAKAAELASHMGCNVMDSVNKNTTILVVGMQDQRKLKGKGKSSKQVKAEKFLSEGIDIKIISEEDFLQLINFN